jgi:hypothetical protein
MARTSPQLLDSPGWITPFEMDEGSGYIVSNCDTLHKNAEVDRFSRTIELEAKYRAERP